MKEKKRRSLKVRIFAGVLSVCMAIPSAALAEDAGPDMILETVTEAAVPETVPETAAQEETPHVVEAVEPEAPEEETPHIVEAVLPDDSLLEESVPETAQSQPFDEMAEPQSGESESGEASFEGDTGEYYEEEFIITPEEELWGPEEEPYALSDIAADEPLPMALDADVVENARIKPWDLADASQAAREQYDREYRVYPAGEPTSNHGNYPHNLLGHAVDGNETTFWETGRTNSEELHSYLEFRFEQVSQIARVVYAPRPSGKGFPYEFEIWASQTDEGEDFVRVATGQSDRTAAFIEISFREQPFKRLRFVFLRSVENYPSCREILFYREDQSDEVMETLFEDYCYYKINEKYNSAEALEALRAQLQSNVKYESKYKPLLDRAEKIVKKELVFNPAFELSTDPNAGKVIERNGNVVEYARKTIRYNSFATNRQVCGIAAYTGDTVTIYVDAPKNDPLPKVQFSQAYGYWSCWLSGEQQLKRGVNTFTVPNFKIAGANYASYDIASGGAIYIVNPYTKEQQSADVKIYIEGGDTYPVYRKNGDENAYRAELTAYADRVRDNPQKVVDLTELVCDHAIMSVSATRADEIYDTKSPKKNLDKWDEVLHETLAFEGIKFDPKDPYYNALNEHLNVNYRVSQVWDGGFMFAYTEHIGLYGRGNGEDLLIYCMDNSGRAVMGWGCIHEMGHMTDLPDRTIGETTNNMPANFVNTYYGGQIRNEDYIAIANSLASDRTWNNNGFNQNRYNYMIFFLLESYYRGYWGDTDNIYRYEDKGQCAAMSRTEKQIYFSSLAAGVDLGYYFERWGYNLSDSEARFTRQGASQAYKDAIAQALSSHRIRTDEKPIWYLDSGEYSYMRDEGDLATGKGGLYSSQNTTEIVRVLKTSDGYSITMPQTENGAHLGYEIWEGTAENRQIIGFTHSNCYTDPTVYQEGYTPTYWAVAYDRLLNKTQMSQPASAKSESGVCELNGVSYDSISQAVAQAQDGEVIYLLKDMVDSGVRISKKLTFLPKDTDVTIRRGGDAPIFSVTGSGSLTLASHEGHMLTLDGDRLIQSHALVEAEAQATFYLTDIRMVNSVSRSFGGAVRVNTASVKGTISRVTLQNNTAVEGGAIYNVGTITATDCTFAGNTAISAGGTLCNTNGGVFYFNGGSITGGTASKGGAVYGNGRTDLNGIQVNHNTAGAGGAIYFYPGNAARSLNLGKNTVIEENMAKTGSFLYLGNSGVANINDAVIKKHTQEDGSYDIYSETGKLTVDGGRADISADIYKNGGSLTFQTRMPEAGRMVITLASFTTAEAVVNTNFTMTDADVKAITLSSDAHTLEKGPDGRSAYITSDRKVTLHPNGGTIKSGNVTGYVRGEYTVLPTNVVKEGHTFAGWFENPDFTGKSVKSIKATDDGDKTYYAKWTLTRYNIVYEKNGGSIQGYLTNNFYDVTQKVELPLQITRKGCEFLGWYDNKDFEGDVYTELPAGTTGNHKFYAKWTCLADEEKKVENEQEATCTRGASYDLVTRCVDCEKEMGRETVYTSDPLGHSFGAWSQRTAASCTADGEEVRICTVCGEEETRPIPAKGHTFAEGSCTVCGAADPDHQEETTEAASQTEAAGSQSGSAQEAAGSQSGKAQEAAGGQSGSAQEAAGGQSGKAQEAAGGQAGSAQGSAEGQTGEVQEASDGQADKAQEAAGSQSGSAQESAKDQADNAQASENGRTDETQDPAGGAQTEAPAGAETEGGQTAGKKADQTETASAKETEARVKPSIKLNYTSLPLQKGKSTTLVKIKSSAPAGVKIKSAKSNRARVAAVKVNKGKLTITARRVGSAKITVTGTNGAKATISVTVKLKVPVTKVKLSKKTATLKRGKKLKLTASITPVTAPTTYTWSTSNRKVAVVNKNGVVTAKGKGKAVITVKTKNGKKATCRITVK